VTNSPNKNYNICRNYRDLKYKTRKILIQLSFLKGFKKEKKKILNANLINYYKLLYSLKILKK